MREQLPMHKQFWLLKISKGTYTIKVSFAGFEKQSNAIELPAKY